MRAVDLQQLLSLHHFTARRVEEIATRLRSVEMLPSGGRGSSAPHITSAQAVHLILAVAGADRIIDAPAVARTLGSLTERSTGMTLFEHLLMVVEGETSGKSICEVHVNFAREHSSARIMRNGGHFFPFYTREGWNTEPAIESMWQGFVGRIGVIGGALLRLVAIEFSEGEVEGELVAE